MAQFDDLHTGNSAIESTFGNEQIPDAKDEAISEQQRELAELLPSVQHIIDACDEEIDAIADIRAYIKELGEKADWMSIQNEYRARELYIGFIQRLRDSITDKVANAENEVNS